MRGVSYTCRRQRRLAWTVAATFVLAAPLMAPHVAAAQPDGPPPSAADREAAARAFSQGQRAFKKGDFRHAAESFETAYKDAPHPSSLWNAARAWHRARELARAANLYAKFLREAPADSRDRNSAQAAIVTSRRRSPASMSWPPTSPTSRSTASRWKARPFT
jgi:hypothetical protein